MGCPLNGGRRHKHRIGRPEITFDPVITQRGQLGWHNVEVGDVNGNGTPDLLSKVWSTDGNYHVDFWRNDTGVE